MKPRLFKIRTADGIFMVSAVGGSLDLNDLELRCSRKFGTTIYGLVEVSCNANYHEIRREFRAGRRPPPNVMQGHILGKVPRHASR